MGEITLWAPSVCAPQDRSFWLQDVGGEAITSALEGAQEADVAIIGGGYCGLWTALRLREADPDLKIVILEADFCGSGASGRNGGQVHSWFAEIDLLKRLVGEDQAHFLCRATAEAIDELEMLQTSGAIDMHLRLDGWYWTASSRAQEGAWQRALDGCAQVGETPFVSLDAQQLRRATGSSASHVGIAETRAGTVHPGRLALGLRELAISRGIEIHECSPVKKIISGSQARVQTDRGELQAPKVVLCTNAWASAVPELRRYMYVVESQVIATEAAPDTLDRLGWRDGKSICDSQANVLYYQRTKAGNVIFGRGSGKVAYNGRFGASFNRSPMRGADNIREMQRVYPALRGLSVTHDWSGPIDCMVEHLPVFGTLRDAPGIFFGVGYNGTGIVQTAVGGRILASLVIGRNDEWSGCGLVGLTRRSTLPPEPIRYLGASIVRRAVRRRNDLEIQDKPVDWPTRMLTRFMPNG